MIATVVALVVIGSVLVAAPVAAGADPFPPEFDAPSFIPTGSEPSTTVILDANQDGDPDIAVLNVISGTLSVLLGDGTGAFGAPVDYSTSGRGTHMVPADMDADGVTDLVVSIREPAGSRGVVILHGDGVGGFDTPVFVPAGPRPHFVDVGDINGDGLLDIAVSHCCGSGDSNFFVQVLFGSASGTFSGPVGYANGGVIGLMTLLRDFDGDGDLDMTTNLRAAGSIAVWANDGTGAFPAIPDYVVVANQSMAEGDLNNDGKPDLVVTDLASTTMNVLFNTSTPGSISFSAPVPVTTAQPTLGAFVEDMDGDGIEDAVVTHQSTGEISVVLGSASGSLSVVGPFAASPTPNRGSAGDLDGDGRVDVAVSSQTVSGGVAVLLAAVPLAVSNCGSTSPIVVDEFSDDDGTTAGCSLREAVAAANALGGTQTIELPAGTHQLSIVGAGEDANATGDIDISDDVVIEAASGADATSVIVDGGATDRVFHVPVGVDATFRDITITNGDAGGSNGGGILVVGSALVERVSLEANTARGGGGIFFDTGSDTEIRDSAIVNNIATDDGGGAESTAGRGSNCPVDLSTCPTRFVNVTVSGNVASQNHGGLSFDNNTDAYLNSVTITENSAGFRTGGLGPGTGGLIYVSNTAIAGNNAVNARNDCDITIVSLGHNFFSDECALFVAVSGLDPTDLQGLTADFGPLQLNDGTTPNHLPNVGSALVDNGHDSGPLPACEAADQRGVVRVDRCDIGAVEGSGGDETPPVITITTPADGATFELGTTVVADYTCVDDDTSVATCVGPVVVGAAIDTSVIGTFTFAVVGTDVAGNSASASTAYSVVDSVLPEVVITTPADGATYEVGAVVEADYGCSDSGSGVSSCVGPVPVGAAVDTSVEGTFSFTVTGTDGAGNVTSVTSSYTVEDTVDPSVTIVTPADGVTYEVGSEVIADYACSDAGTGVTGCAGEVLVGNPIDTSVEGTFTFTVVGTDDAGNVTSVTHSYAVEDSTDPVVTITTPADGGAYEIGSEVLADYICTDGGTGVATCVGDVVVGEPIDTSVVGAFTFDVTGTDVAGNSTVVTHTYTVEDTGDPVVTITTPADGVVIEAGDVVEVAYTCADAGTGVASCVGDLPVGSALDTSVEGTFDFTVTGVDGVGNTTTVTHSYTVEDTGSPEVIVTTPADAASYEIGSTVVADYSCSDASGVLPSCVGDVALGGSVDTSSLGTFTFTVVGTDAAGNATSVTGSYDVVDTVQPEVTIVTPADGATYEIGSSVAADYSCADTGSGVASCNGDVAFGDSIDTSTVGVRVFTVIATDVAGNITVATQAYEVVDTGAPTVAIITPADGAVLEAGDVVAADYSCSDPGTGLATCAGPLAIGDLINTSVEGSFSFTVVGTDNVGNVATASSTYAVVDTVDPVVSIASPADGVEIEAGDVVTVSFSCTDGGTGVVSCDGDQPDGSLLDTTVPGSYTFAVTGTDAAGNATTVVTSYDVVDTMAPMVVIATPGDGASYEVGAVVDVDFSCTDAGSGVASCVGSQAVGSTLDTSTEGVFSFTVVATDNAGNESVAVHFYAVEDTVLPAVTITTPADGGSYEVGSVVVAEYGCTDAGTGVAACVGDVAAGASLDTSVVGTFTFTVVGTDGAGNATTVTATYDVVDTVAPEVLITTPADGAVLAVGDVVEAEYECADSGTGVATCVGDVPTGSPIDTTVAGTFTFSVTAADGAGLTTTVTHTYEVQAAKTIDDLIATIESYDLRWGVERALVVKAKIAQWQLDRGHERGALRTLRKLERWVRFFEGRKLTSAQAAELVGCLDDLQDQLRAMIGEGGGHHGH